MDKQSLHLEKDIEVLQSIVREMAASMSGEESTRHCAEDAIWFDIGATASKGVTPAYKEFDEAFSNLASCDVTIKEMDVLITERMGIVCTIQSWDLITKKDNEKSNLLVRQTDCFEKQNGEWKLIHQHSSTPAGGEWDGKYVL